MRRAEDLLQAILENPDEDAPRLIYADWLEEHGQRDRAQFIRVQCRLAQLPEDDPHRPDLEAREQELLDAHGDEWLGSLSRSVQDGGFGPSYRFCRGLVEEVTLPAATFLQHG
jgi:uncharacterized protein (TIGR02996 family)